jgi:hypothetical protein
MWERKLVCNWDKTCAFEDEPLHDTILRMDKSKLQTEMHECSKWKDLVSLVQGVTVRYFLQLRATHVVSCIVFHFYTFRKSGSVGSKFVK